MGFSKVARDITQRKRTEEALRQSEERFELAAQAGKVYAYENHLHTETVVRSSEYAKILGLTEPEHFTYQQFLDGIHPADRSAFLEAVADSHQLLLAVEEATAARNDEKQASSPP